MKSRVLSFFIAIVYLHTIIALESRESLTITISTESAINHLDAIPSALKTTVSALLDIKATDIGIQVNQILSKTIDYRIILYTKDNPVSDSIETPIGFAFWKQKWCDKIKNLKTLTAIASDSTKLSIPVSNDQCTSNLAITVIDENDYFTNQLRTLSPLGGYALQDYIENDKNSTMLLKITQGHQYFSQYYESLENILVGLSTVASSLFNVPQTSIYVTELIPETTSMIFKFVVYPLGNHNEEYYTSLWNQAIVKRDERLTKYIDYIDFEYPAVEPYLQTYAPTERPKQGGLNQTITVSSAVTGYKSYTGIVLGSVVGGVVGVAVLITAAFLVKKRIQSAKSSRSVYEHDQEGQEDVYVPQ